jgi:hypothetical protein
VQLLQGSNSYELDGGNRQVDPQKGKTAVMEAVEEAFKA